MKFVRVWNDNRAAIVGDMDINVDEDWTEASGGDGVAGSGRVWLSIRGDAEGGLDVTVRVDLEEELDAVVGGLMTGMAEGLAGEETRRGCGMNDAAFAFGRVGDLSGEPV